VRDARQHGVEIRPADVNFSDWDCTLESIPTPTLPLSGGGNVQGNHAVRLGFRLIGGLQEDELNKLVAARGNGFSSIERLAAVAGISRFTIERLAEADAFRSLGLDRRAALWTARRLDVIGIKPTALNRHPEVAAQRPSKDERSERSGRRPPRLPPNKSGGAPQGDGRASLPLLAPHMSDELFPEPAVALPAMPLAEHVVEDYVATGLSLKAHPVSFFRQRLTALGALRNAALRGDDLRQDMTVTVAGLVLVRQRPGTAKGVIFMTLEDETDIANIIVWPKAFEQNRRTVMTARFLAVRGRLQRAGLVIHVVAERFIDLSAELSVLHDGALPDRSDVFAPKFSGVQHPLDTQLLLKSRDFH
jgi:error-prone DNA polymerase